MQLLFGPLIIELNQSIPDQIEIRVVRDVGMRFSDVVKAQLPAPPAVPAPQEIDREAAIQNIKMLVQAGFSRKTLAMIVNKVLHVPCDGDSLNARFGGAERLARDFLARPIEPDVWALYIAPLDVPGEGPQTAVIGLTGKNQLAVLALENGSPKGIFDRLSARGLKPTQIKLGILSMHSDVTKEFKGIFPQAVVALDWKEYIDLTVGTELRDFMKRAFTLQDPFEIEEALKEAKAPEELATFMSFHQDLWRALKTTAPVNRLAMELKGKLRSDVTYTKEQRSLVKAFAILRLQYHWFKIPVDAPQLKNLRYIKESQSDTPAASNFS